MSSEVSASGSASKDSERAAMQRALDLARRGWGRVAPNPLVGAVVLSGDAVVGEGYHAEYGGPHAEVVALQVAGERARGATLVVNLEPCAHHGKTPPCTDAIVKAGVTRVVVIPRNATFSFFPPGMARVMARACSRATCASARALVACSKA